MNLLKTALTFDDVLLVPAHSTTMPKEVSMSTSSLKISRLIRLFFQRQWIQLPRQS